MELPPQPVAALSAATPPATPAAAGHGLRQVRTGDVDEQAELLAGWNQRYAQLSAGAFEGCIEEAWLDGVHLFVETTGRRLMQGGRLDAQRLAIGLPLAPGRGPAVFCGARDWGLGDSRGAGARYCSFSGAEGFEFFTPEGLVMAGLEFDRDELAALASPDEQARLEAVGARAGLHLAGAGGVAGLRDFMQGAFEMLRRQPGLIENPAVRGMLRQAALSNALEALLAATPAPEDGAPPRARALVEQARALIEREPETPQTVAMLCLALGVSRRTLQAAFQQVLGLAPAAFLRAVRLAGARRALREAASVTEAAALWGFWHFGHFAQDFRRMFGELPSQAWRRLHPPG